MSAEAAAFEEISDDQTLRDPTKNQARDHVDPIRKVHGTQAWDANTWDFSAWDRMGWNPK